MKSKIEMFKAVATYEARLRKQLEQCNWSSSKLLKRLARVVQQRATLYNEVCAAGYQKDII